MVVTDDKVRKDMKNIITIVTDLDEEVKELKNELYAIKKDISNQNIKNAMDETEQDIGNFLDSLENKRTITEQCLTEQCLSLDIDDGGVGSLTSLETNDIERYLESVLQPYVRNQVKIELCKALDCINEKFVQLEQRVSNLRSALVVNKASFTSK